MFTKFLVVGSRMDPASMNILTNLSDISEGKFDFYLIDGEMLDTRCLDRDKINKYDYVIFASKHKSEKINKTLSIHAPGNFREVWGGGEEGKLSPASALFQKHLFLTLKKIKDESELNRYSITLEATHHGPLIERPSVFIEIGGSEEEWRDKKASFVVAKVIKKAIETWEENPYHEIAIGIGGPHYCPAFDKLQLDSNIAISHIIPKYISPINEGMIMEAINNTVEEVDFAVLDWKGLGKAEERDEVIRILEKNYIQWKKA
ncbi:MAG: D-aminoacyl-tRNA deacylase [archaeon]|nr:D-aminoacyl-tRNA deacylase [archaeon]